jgi:hypothetical protein
MADWSTIGEVLLKNIVVLRDFTVKEEAEGDWRGSKVVFF